jgi:hypothetical protein
MDNAYETFLRDATKALSGAEIVLTLRDLSPGRRKYRGVNARCVVSRPARPGEPLLWIRSVVGTRDPQPCSVRIVEELPETFLAAPYSDFFEAMARAERR